MDWRTGRSQRERKARVMGLDAGRDDNKANRKITRLDIMTWHRLLRHFRSVKDCRDRNNVVEDLDERCSLLATVIDEPKATVGNDRRLVSVCLMLVIIVV